MTVYGIDFTSRPSRSKAITCTTCELDGNRLVVGYLQRLESLGAFDAFLDSPRAMDGRHRLPIRPAPPPCREPALARFLGRICGASCRPIPARIPRRP